MFKGLSTTIFDLNDVSSDLMREGCWGFLAHVVDSHAIEPWLEDIPVACEFLEAFLKDLPRLPPAREMDFAINLVPRTTPTSKVPYHTVWLQQSLGSWRSNYRSYWICDSYDQVCHHGEPMSSLYTRTVIRGYA